MLIENKIGNLSTMPVEGKSIDWLMLEWYETRKKIIRKWTSSGRELALKLLNANTELSEGDVLLEEADKLTVISIIPCDCIVIQPNNVVETASLCYEIGNRHLPLFYEDGLLLTPSDTPFFNWLIKQGHEAKIETRKLLQPLRTTVAPHSIGFSQDFVITAL